MPGLNLLPWRAQRCHAGIRRLQGLLLGVGLLAALIVGLTDHFGRQAQHRHLLESASIQQVIEHFDVQLAQIALGKVEQEQVLQMLQALEHLQSKRHFQVDLLERLEQVLPQDVHFTTVTRTGARLDIRGLAHSGSLVAQLLRNLSSVIGEADVQQMKAVDEGEAFELSVALREAS